MAASFRLACASYSWDPPPSPLPSTTPGHFAKSLQDFPDFLPAAPGCGWGGGGNESSPALSWPALFLPESTLCLRLGGIRVDRAHPQPGPWKEEGPRQKLRSQGSQQGPGRWAGHHCL